MKDITAYFNSLNLTKWRIAGNQGKGGQAVTIEVKNLEDETIGMFRTLSRTTEQDIKRFYRELDIILANPHKNIIEILDYTRDTKNQWYISKKGERFETYWKGVCEKHTDNPDGLLKEAIRVILGIT